MPNNQHQTKPNNLNIAKQPKQTKQLKQCQTAKPNQTKELIFLSEIYKPNNFKIGFNQKKKTQEGNFDEKKNQTALKGNFNEKKNQTT